MMLFESFERQPLLGVIIQGLSANEKNDFVAFFWPRVGEANP